MNLKLGLAGAIALFFSNSVFAETMSNDTIITLTKAGLSDGLIIDKIDSSSCGYDVTTDKIINLKKSGLSDNVISAMVRRCATLGNQRGLSGDDSSADPSVKHSPGIYLLESWASPNKLQGMHPSKSSGLKSTGNGSIIFPLIYKMIVPGSKSSLELPTTLPVFYFYFNVSDEKVSDFGMENSIAAQSPDEFSLVKMKNKENDREISIGKVSFYGGAPVSMRKGVDPKVNIPFDTVDMDNGIYKVTAKMRLEAGEYAFVFTGANGNARIYDFSVSSPVAATVSQGPLAGAK